NMGIDFRGGSEFTVSGVENTDPVLGEEAVSEVVPETEATATNIAGGTIRVQTTELSDEQTLEVAENLQQGYKIGRASCRERDWSSDVCSSDLTWALISEVVLSSLCQASRIRIPYSVKRLFPKWFRKPKRQQQILLAAPSAFRQQNCRMNRLLRLPRIYNRDT